MGQGRGYVTAENNKEVGLPIGIIPVDSIYTPVRKVNFTVDKTRVGKVADYDNVITSYSIHYTKLYDRGYEPWLQLK